MKKIIKVLKWSAIIVFTIPALIYLVWLTGNLKNHELDAEIASLLSRRVIQLDEKSNAYFDTVGLSAPNHMEPHAWGVALFTQVRANDRALNEGKTPTGIKLEGYPTGSISTELPCFKKDSKLSCLEEIAADPSVVKKVLDNESLLLKRFDSTLGKSYQEPERDMNYQSDLVSIAPKVRVAKLALIRNGLEIIKGHDDDALSKWEKETTFLLYQAKESHGLIEKVVLIYALDHYQKLLSDYLSLYPHRAKIRAKKIRAMLEPFKKESVSLQSSFEYEAIYASTFILSVEDWAKMYFSDDPNAAQIFLGQVLMPFFDKRATANQMALSHLRWSRIIALEGDSYRIARKEMAKEIAVDQNSSIFGTLRYHNPVGKIMLQAAVVDASQYCFKSDNIIANKILLNFAFSMASQNVIRTDQINRAIQKRQLDLKHPFCGVLPVWDENSRTFSYPNPEQTNVLNFKPLLIKL